jgi:hypothetical protein
MKAAHLSLAAVLLLCACRDAQPPLPTSRESDRLNEAEAMLNGAGDEKGPEATASGPSSNSD